MQLYIANQNYSSWSLRAWLIFDIYGLDVERVKLQLSTQAFYAQLAAVTPAAKVPVLVDEGVTIWDSLAILEYINEKYLEGRAWPGDIQRRAKARCLAAEMHSGFMHLRSEYPMNCRARRRVQGSAEAQRDIARIDALWGEQMAVCAGEGEGWLFGDWSIVDAMYAPVALRAATYDFALSDAARIYQQKVLSCPSVKTWLQQARQEPEIIAMYEVGRALE